MGKNSGLKSAAHAHGTQSILNAIEAGVILVEHCTLMDDTVIEEILKRDLSRFLLSNHIMKFLHVALLQESRNTWLILALKFMPKLPRFQKALKAGVKLLLAQMLVHRILSMKM